MFVTIWHSSNVKWIYLAPWYCTFLLFLPLWLIFLPSIIFLPLQLFNVYVLHGSVLIPCLTSFWSLFLCKHNPNVHLMISTSRSLVIACLLRSSSTYSFVYSPIPPNWSIDSSNSACPKLISLFSHISLSPLLPQSLFLLMH